jgi:nucleotide-binding universal stress UspA family protein
MYSKILVALDGSEYSLAGGEIALTLARGLGAEIVASHIYDARLHSTRFQEMEPSLPEEYQEEESIGQLREDHKGLIFEGFEALSKGYIEQFLESANKAKVFINQVHNEGRNYVELLNIAREYKIDLIIMGAQGLGKVQEGLLGSTAGRILLLAQCDVLIVRRSPFQGKVLVGIDGSSDALAALRKAAQWGRTLGKSLNLVSVYDPYFHDQVFKTMAQALSPERQQEVGLSKQEALHEKLINEGLAKLYQSFLDQAHEKCLGMGVQAETKLLRGKVFKALIDYAQSTEVDLIVLGRFGHHHEDVVQIGSNSEAVARFTQTNVLVTEPLRVSKKTLAQKNLPLEWDKEALDRLDRIPPFARSMAKAGIENFVRSKDGTRVTFQDVQELARRFGMRNDEKANDE